MNRNMLYFVIGALLVVVIGLGITVWREESRPDGVEIKLDDKGISVQGN